MRTLYNRSSAPFALLATVIIAGCTTGQANVTPNITTGPLGGTFEAAVGTVNFNGAAAGLNVVETFRGSNGYTAVPVNTVTVSGPAGFAGVAGSGDPGAGAAAVNLGSQFNAFAVGPTGTNLAAADAFGMGPPGSSTTGANAFPEQPQFGDVVGTGLFGASGEARFYGGPPAYPPPSGTAGFPEVFYLVATGAAAPPTGTYTVTSNYSQNGNAGSKTASPMLASNALLAVIAAPTYTTDGAGGGTVHVTVPGAPVSEAIVNITDTTSGISATVETTTAGAQNLNVPDSLGFKVGDSLTLQAIGFDYDDFGLTAQPPPQAPAMPVQADVTVSARTTTAE